MRILGYQRKWPKLDQDESTTFRYPRADKDWQVGEFVQVVIKPRSKDREFLYYAEIISIELVHWADITDKMALIDGFTDKAHMIDFFNKTYRNDYRWLWHKSMNRLTIRWVERFSG